MADSRPRVKTRTRTEVLDSFDYQFWWDDGRLAQPGNGSFHFDGSQKTISEGHTWPPRRGNKRDIGGDFFTEKTFVEGKPSFGRARYPSAGSYKNFAGAHYYPGDIPALPSKPSNSTLDSYGTTAIARVEPTRAPADVATLLGELFREGLPSMLGLELWKNKTELARAAGSEYLNFQFGWKPLVSDVQAFAKAVKNARAILKQYRRDEGRLVRRRYDFPSVSQTLSTKTTSSFGKPLTSEPEMHGEKMVDSETRLYTDIWFSGAFTYYIPQNSVLENTLDRYVTYADRILGLELTPEVLWNLAPWSWAVDWFSNVGDVLHNLSAFNQDHLVMRWGYIMHHQKVVMTNRWPASLLTGGYSTAGWWRATSERKIRRRATPYGFGINLNSLSDYQWSILGALGMTKGPKLL